MFVFYIWIALVIFFTLANRKYRIVIERDQTSGKLVLNYYVGNYLMQRLRTSLQLLGGERFEVRNTTLGGGVAAGGRAHSVTAYAVCMIRNRRVLLQTSAIQNRSKASKVVEALQAYVRDPSPARVEVGAYQVWLLWLAFAFLFFIVATAVALYYFELNNRVS